MNSSFNDTGITTSSTENISGINITTAPSTEEENTNLFSNTIPALILPDEFLNQLHQGLDQSSEQTAGNIVNVVENENIHINATIEASNSSIITWLENIQEYTNFSGTK